MLGVVVFVIWGEAEFDAEAVLASAPDMPPLTTFPPVVEVLVHPLELEDDDVLLRLAAE